GAVNQFADRAFDQQEECAQAQRSFGAQILVHRTAHLSEGDPSRFARVEDVPEDLAMSAALQVEVECLHDPHGVGHLFTLLPWLPRAAPEALHLPAPLVRALHRPWTPERTFQVLRGHHEKDVQQAAARAEKAASAGPSRSGPCPCGSGRKYKRCCVDAPAALPRAA